MQSDHGLYRIAYFFAIIMAWVKLLTYTDKSFESLHPPSWHLLIQDMWNLGGVSFNCNAKHGNTHRPRGISYWEVYVFVVWLNVLSYQAAVHDVINWTNHVFISSSISQDM